MQLTDILEVSCIKVPMQAAEKYQAITELLKLLHKNVSLSDYQAAHQAVIEREAIRSTGVGQGFAIPHAKTNSVDRLVMALGKLEKPIDFNSIDGQPVSMIFLLLSPLDQIGPHIQAIAQISRLMTDQKLKNKLLNSGSAKDLYQHIIGHEQASE